MISKEKMSSVLYGFIAFLFSLILFFTANGQGIPSTLTSSPESYEQTARNVVIQPLYDSDKYYVHGFENTASVRLTSANRIQLNAESNPDTRTFRVTADLSDLKEGTHEVRLRTQGLSSAVTSQINPGTITVTIEKKVTREVDVVPEVQAEATPSGFEIEKPTVSPEKVTITTGDKTFEQINQVVAQVPASTVTDQAINNETEVKALDSQGQPLSVLSNPEKVTVQAGVNAPEKTVGLYAIQEGAPPTGIRRYDFRFSEVEARITGTQAQLSAINSIAVPVNVTGIQQVTSRTVTIPVSEGMTVSPRSVTIRITPILGTSGTQDTATSEDESQTETSGSN